MQELGGQAKAMVITASRQGAVKYRQAFEEYITKKGYDGIHALVAFSGKVKLPDDDKEYTEASINGFPEDRLTKEFDTDNYQVLLVANKYQTGFDQPKLCAMYVLKKLRGVNAVQTLSRLNRICAPYDKKTFVLDFVNTYEDIKAAFAPYYTTTLLANSVTPNAIYDLEATIDAYALFDPADIEAANDILYSQKVTGKQKQRLTFFLQKSKKLLNQILKTTVTLLLRNGKVQAKYKDDLKKKMLYFSNVEIIEPTGIKWSSIRFQRNNQTYRMLVSICQLIIEGMLITTDPGDYRLASFVDEQRMCRLYEKFILEYYSRHYPELSVSASQIPWSLDDGIGTMLPVMQSDIHLQRGNTVLIIDAKYYSHTTQSQFDKHTIHSNNLYQIFTYVKNRSYQFGEEKNTVSGMLLYAKTEEEIQPDNVYQMHGSQISVKTLDLNQPFAEIANQMDKIVKSHFSGLTKAY